MKLQCKHFALVAVLGSLLASMLLAGCGGNSDDTSATGNSANGTGKAAKDKEE